MIRKSNVGGPNFQIRIDVPTRKAPQKRSIVTYDEELLGGISTSSRVPVQRNIADRIQVIGSKPTSSFIKGRKRPVITVGGRPIKIGRNPNANGGEKRSILERITMTK